MQNVPSDRIDGTLICAVTIRPEIWIVAVSLLESVTAILFETASSLIGSTTSSNIAGVVVELSAVSDRFGSGVSSIGGFKVSVPLVLCTAIMKCCGAVPVRISV